MHLPETAVFTPADNTLQGRSVLIVGGTSGLGLAAARQTTAAGATVTVVGRDARRAEKATADNGLAGWRAADVTDPEALAAALADIGRVDHLALLAGSFTMGKLLEADLGQLHRAFDERVWAAVHVLRALSDRMVPAAQSPSSPACSPTGRARTAPPCSPLRRLPWGDAGARPRP